MNSISQYYLDVIHLKYAYQLTSQTVLDMTESAVLETIREIRKF